MIAKPIQSTMSKDQKIIIVGSGVYGLSSAYHLSFQGYSNIHVFDRGFYNENDFSPLKGADGASTDLNKLIRASYVDKIHYQDLAIESLKQYHIWNQEFLKLSFLPSGLSYIQERCLRDADFQPLFQNTGYIRLDDIDTGEELRNLANFEAAGLRKLSYDINNPDDIARAKISGWYNKLDPMNQRESVPSLTGVLDSFAGVALADKCLLWVKYLCERSGNVEFHYGTQGELTKLLYNGDDNSVKGIITKDGKTHTADWVVLAAGGWTTKFLPEELTPRLEAVGSSYILIQIPKDRQDLLNKYRRWPMINWRMTYESNFRDDAMYVFPATVDGIIKMGLNDHFWRHLEVTNDGSQQLISVPKTDYPLLPKKSLNDYKKFIRQWMPDIWASGAKIEKHKLCFVSLGQRNELVIDKIPGHANLIVCAGGGFHGFKFLPVIGKFTEALISGKEYKYGDMLKFDKINVNEYDRKPVNDEKHKHALNSTTFASDKKEYFDWTL